MIYRFNFSASLHFFAASKKVYTEFQPPNSFRKVDMCAKNSENQKNRKQKKPFFRLEEGKWAPKIETFERVHRNSEQGSPLKNWFLGIKMENILIKKTVVISTISELQD